MARGQKMADGATRVAPNGYHYIKIGTKWVLRHRVTIERELGRPLRDNERCRFKDGYTKEDWDNPNAIEVYVVREKSNAARIAQIQAKIAELQAELSELESE